jgi:hypothetical protein
MYNTMQDQMEKSMGTMEEVQKNMVAMPYDAMEKIGPMSSYAKDMKEMQVQAVSNVYDVLRASMQQMKVMLDEMMSTMEAAVPKAGK